MVDDDHRKLGKNGHDQAQDRELRELRAVVEKYHESIERYRAEDDVAHEQIFSRLHAISVDMARAQVRDEVRAEYQATEHADTAALRKSMIKAFVTLLTALLAQGAALLGWGWDQFASVRDSLEAQTKAAQEHVSALERRVDKVDVRTAADWANGREWGERIDRTDSRQDQELFEIRRRLGMGQPPRDERQGQE